MRLWAGTIAIAAVALPSVLAAQAKPPASPLPAPASPDARPAFVAERITVDELKKLQETDKVLVVDVRSAEAYKGGHIPGAVSAPLGEIDKHVPALKSAKKELVTYCTWAAEATSVRAALKLNTAGVPGVRALLGGFGKWQSEGNPVVQGDSPR